MPTGKTPQGSPNDTRTLMTFIILAVLFTSILNMFLSAVTTRKVEEITYTQFLQMLEEKTVNSVEILEDRLVITQKSQQSPEEQGELHYFDGAQRYFTGRVDDPDF